MRKYRCVHEVMSLPLTGGVRRSRCSRVATFRFRIKWADGSVRIRRACSDHAVLVRRSSARMFELGSVQVVAESSI